MELGRVEADLGKHKNKITITDLENTRLEEIASSVDEGDAGKLKLLCVIVFDDHHDGEALPALLYKLTVVAASMLECCSAQHEMQGNDAQ